MGFNVELIPLTTPLVFNQDVSWEMKFSPKHFDGTLVDFTGFTFNPVLKYAPTGGFHWTNIVPTVVSADATGIVIYLDALTQVNNIVNNIGDTVANYSLEVEDVLVNRCLYAKGLISASKALP